MVLCDVGHFKTGQVGVPEESEEVGINRFHIGIREERFSDIF